MNVNKGLDRRIVRTRSMICEAFLSILHRKVYDEISVVDIAEQANINRSTFYAHFIDKEDLLDKMVADKMELLSALIHNPSDAAGLTPAFNAPDPIFLTLFEHVFEYDHFYRVMLLGTTAGNFRAALNGIVRESFFIRISKLGMDQRLQVPLDVLLDYISLSTCGIIERWLEGNKVYSPHHMALQLTRLAFLGVYKSMGAVE
ncbi:TetR/AcrR family transcriptional regulator [Paenibacillus aurantiacus]|uniref:TetR/AcrR family transcriptional regulator n=1 Tax=Paenibacillus aurantiacus TaxID=1936118 RepID=A0ABV5KTY6_9BACL